MTFRNFQPLHFINFPLYKLNKPYKMKKTILLITLLLLIAACKSDKKQVNPNLEKLQSDKKELLFQMDSLSTVLKKIEIDISKLDTIKKLQKVTVFTTKDTVFNHYIALQGVVASDQNVNLHPEIGGTVKRIFVKEGQKVSKGQTLIQLDASMFKDKVSELKTQLNLATTTFERQERLWNQKIGSEMQYLGAKTQKEALEKSLNSLYTQIGKMKVKAPFSGIIDQIYAKTGELSSPQMPMLRLINLNKMYLEADVPETFLSKIKKGTPVLVDFVSINKQLVAKINEIGNFINPNNRSFKIKIEVSNKDHKIKPNLLADIKINDLSAKGIVLPTNLIQINQKGEQFVYAIRTDTLKTTVVKKTLTLGESYNNEVLILTGLKANETIVNKGGKFVKDGDEVEISK